jgi:hypothetical protein
MEYTALFKKRPPCRLTKMLFFNNLPKARRIKNP